jgi:hypothetical protein
MKKIFIYLLFSSLLFTSHAQEKKELSPEERAKQLTGWMTTYLQLTEDQIKQVQPINQEYSYKLQELKNSHLSKTQKMKILKSDSSAKDAQLKKIFTSEQYKTYESKKAELTKKLKQQLKERSS